MHACASQLGLRLGKVSWQTDSWRMSKDPPGKGQGRSLRGEAESGCGGDSEDQAEERASSERHHHQERLERARDRNRTGVTEMKLSGHREGI